MKKFYIPYNGTKPATVSINGHQLLIVSDDKTTLAGNLEDLNADHCEAIRGGSSERDHESILTNLARQNKAGLVVAHSEIPMPQLLESLKAELPWMQ
jgi:hypothetical protein